MSEDERILTLTHRSAVGNHISMKLIDLPICMQRGQRDTLDYTFPPPCQFHALAMARSVLGYSCVQANLWQWTRAVVDEIRNRQLLLSWVAQHI